MQVNALGRCLGWQAAPHPVKKFWGGDEGGQGSKFPQTSLPEAQGQIDGKREETAQFSVGALNSTQNFRVGSPTTTPKPETPPQLPDGAGGRSAARQHPTTPRFQ